jgi:hypothetical protein
METGTGKRNRALTGANRLRKDGTLKSLELRFAEHYQ